MKKTVHSTQYRTKKAMQLIRETLEDDPLGMLQAFTKIMEKRRKESPKEWENLRKLTRGLLGEKGQGMNLSEMIHEVEVRQSLNQNKRQLELLVDIKGHLLKMMKEAQGKRRLTELKHQVTWLNSKIRTVKRRIARKEGPSRARVAREKRNPTARS
jgi:hypothetical protein